MKTVVKSVNIDSALRKFKAVMTPFGVLGLVLLFKPAVLSVKIFGAVLFLSAVLVLLIKEGFEFDFVKKRMKAFVAFGSFKWGKWVDVPKQCYISFYYLSIKSRSRSFEPDCRAVLLDEESYFRYELYNGAKEDVVKFVLELGEELDCCVYDRTDREEVQIR